MESLRGQNGGKVVLPTCDAIQSARLIPYCEAVLLISPF